MTILQRNSNLIKIIFSFYAFILSHDVLSQECYSLYHKGTSNEAKCNANSVKIFFTSQGSFSSGEVTHRWYTSETGDHAISPEIINNSNGLYNTGMTVYQSDSRKSYWVEYIERRSGCPHKVGPRREVKATFGSAAFSNIVTNLPPTGDICSGDMRFTAQGGSVSRWILNGSTIPGVTSQSYTPTQSGTYKVEVNTSCGKRISSGLTVSIIPPLNPAVTIHPAAVSVCKGTPVRLTANPTGVSAIPDYQWNIGGEIFTGKTVEYLVKNDVTATLTLTSKDPCANYTTVTAARNLSIATDLPPSPHQTSGTNPKNSLEEYNIWV